MAISFETLALCKKAIKDAELEVNKQVVSDLEQYADTAAEKAASGVKDSAVQDAKKYTDDAVGNANQYTDEAVSGANEYTDTAIAGAEEKFGQSLDEAKQSMQQECEKSCSDNLASAKEYTNTVLGGFVEITDDDTGNVTFKMVVPSGDA